MILPFNLIKNYPKKLFEEIENIFNIGECDKYDLYKISNKSGLFLFDQFNIEGLKESLFLQYNFL